MAGSRLVPRHQCNFLGGKDDVEATRQRRFFGAAADGFLASREPVARGL